MKKFVRYNNEIMKYQTRNKKATQTHTHTVVLIMLMSIHICEKRTNNYCSWVLVENIYIYMCIHI